jgi:hypothetical protein
MANEREVVFDTNVVDGNVVTDVSEVPIGVAVPSWCCRTMAGPGSGSDACGSRASAWFWHAETGRAFVYCMDHVPDGPSSFRPLTLAELDALEVQAS